jgi:hypothetical protein
MYDPRWDDVREREDGRARVYDQRDQTEHDPRDGLMHDLDLPRGDARELVIDRDRVYELNGEDSRMLAAVGTFRVVPEQDLGTDRDHDNYDTLDHLRDEGLIRVIALGERERAVVLTAEGLDLLDANRRDRDEGESQTFYAGVNRPRELEHDAHLYTVYREEEARVRHDHVQVRRIVLEQDLKREYQQFLQDHNRDRSNSDGRPDRDEEEIRRWHRTRSCRTSTTACTSPISASSTRSTVASAMRMSRYSRSTTGALTPPGVRGQHQIPEVCMSAGHRLA